ncbi:MAG: hypothetical protein Q9211_006325 [Gyalolechia sp. 1 TL-2023]
MPASKRPVRNALVDPQFHVRTKIHKFKSALAGIGTIRAFAKADVYADRLFDMIDAYARATWYIWLFNRWLAFRLNIIGAFFAILVAVVIVSTKDIDASLAGFALSFALQYSGAITFTIRQHTNIEQALLSPMLEGRPRQHAVYHSLIRRHLIEFENTKGNFDFEPASGRREDADVTSYHVDQKSWGPARKDFPSILFTYARPSETNSEASNQFMYFNRMIVLDKDHRPVRAFSELNSTLSSKVEGFRLEAISRLNQKITSRDILARMPPEVTAIRGAHRIVRPQCKSNALSMRRREFRGRNGLLSWTPREGSKEVKEYLDSIIGPRLLALNDTRGMRPLTDEEVNHILFLGGKGTHPERSRHKASNRNSKSENRTKKPQLDEPQEDETSESEIPLDFEDEFEPINPGDIENEAFDSEVTSDSIRDLLGPFDPSDNEDESSAILPSPLISDMNFDDFWDRRNHVPLNYGEMHVIAEAMAPSIEHYKYLLDVDIRFDTSNFQRESYNVQWSAMQEALERGWVAQGRNPEECPLLTRFERWEADMWNWTEIPMETQTHWYGFM